MRSVRLTKRSRTSFLTIALLFAVLIAASAAAQTAPSKWFAHRGFRGLHPENTIEAMKRSLHFPSVVLEMDLAITKDKRVVISHDAVLNPKLTLDSNGGELDKTKKIALYNLAYNQLAQYDVGLKPNADFPGQARYKAHIPLFADLIDSVDRYAATAGLNPPVYFVETKLKPETDGKYHPCPEEFVDLTLDVIFDKGIQDRVIVQSFDPRTLQIIHKKYPNLPLAFLAKAGSTIEQNIAWLGFTPTYYSANSEAITRASMAACKQLGMVAVAGDCKNYTVYLRLAKLGVQCFIADYPLEYLKKASP